MEKIKKWLENGGSFQEGIILLSPHCRNQHKMSGILRREDMEKLRYELEKIVSIYEPKPPGSDIFNLGAFSREDINQFCHEIKKASNQNFHEGVLQKPNERLQVVIQGRVRYEDLPENIRATYDKACEDWREMRSLHEKMKLVKTDEERAGLRERLDVLDDSHRKAWADIDGWGSTLGNVDHENQAAQSPKKTSIPIIGGYLEVNAARRALSGYIKKLDTETDPAKIEELKAKSRERVAVIKAAGGSFGKLEDKLRTLGILV